MENQFEAWLNSNLHIPQSTLKENLQKCSSSQVIGRKINSNHIIKTKTHQPNKHKVIDIPISLMKHSISRTRNKSLSKSPMRCQSQRQCKLEKNIPNCPNHNSPTRQIRKHKESIKSMAKSNKNETKQEKLKNSEPKTLLIESNNKSQLEKHELLITNLEDKLKSNSKKRDKQKITSKRSQKKNSIMKHVISDNPKSWNYNQPKIIKDESKENNELRLKIKTDKESSKRKPRKVISIDLQYPSKSRQNINPPKEEKIYIKKKTESDVQNYLKLKDTTTKNSDLQRQFEENLTERASCHAFEKLEKMMSLKKKKLKKKNNKPNGINDDKSAENHCLANTVRIQTKNKSKDMIKNKTHKKNSELLTKRLKKIQERIYSSYNSIKIEAAIRIQRWFRSVLRKKKKNSLKNKTDISRSSSAEKYITTQCEEWVSFLNPSPKFKEMNSELVDTISEKLIEENKTIENAALTSEIELKSH